MLRLIAAHFDEMGIEIINFSVRKNDKIPRRNIDQEILRRFEM